MLETLLRNGGSGMADTTPIFLTVKQVAERLQRSTRMVKQYIYDGKLQAIQYTNRGVYLITEQELERFIRDSYTNKNSHSV